MIEKFELIVPDHLPRQVSLIKKFDANNYSKSEVFFYKNKKHIVIYRQQWFTRKDTGETELLANQIEIPAAGIQWVVDTLENKFFKPHHEGGLPPDKFYYSEVVAGEELVINRGVSVGGKVLGAMSWLISTVSAISQNLPSRIFTCPIPFCLNMVCLIF